MKTCNECELEKEDSLFVKNRYKCKLCHSKRKALYYQNNKEYVIKKSIENHNKNKTARLSKFKEYRESNKQKISDQRKKHYNENKSSYAKKSKIYREENKDSIKSYLIKNHEDRKIKRRGYLKKRLSNPKHRLIANLRNRFKEAIRNKAKRGSAVKDLGCTGEELQIYIEAKFYNHPITNITMTWENWGLGPNKWQIDHIIEFQNIDVENLDQLQTVLHFSNLQPLWHEDHVKKTWNKSLDNPTPIKVS